MKEKCPYCGNEYKSLERHLPYCKKKPLDEEIETSDEVLEEIDTPTPIEKESVPEVFKMNQAEKTWIDGFIRGFRFCGQVSNGDVPFLVSVFTKNINTEVKGCLTCPNTLIWMATCVTKKYEELS